MSNLRGALGDRQMMLVYLAAAGVITGAAIYMLFAYG